MNIENIVMNAKNKKESLKDIVNDIPVFVRSLYLSNNGYSVSRRRIQRLQME